MNYTEGEILSELDLASNGVPGKYYPVDGSGDIKYNFFLDLEHGYFNTASSRIHLYADGNRWAIVFEKAGYQNRASSAEIELDYIGNSVNYPVAKYPGQNYIANNSTVTLISPQEYERIENKDGEGLETFELISPNAEYVMVRNKKVKIEHNPEEYTEVGITLRDYDNPKHLVAFEDLVRYLNETEPESISATESEIRLHIPADLPKIMSIDKFHFESVYEKTTSQVCK